MAEAPRPFLSRPTFELWWCKRRGMTVAQLHEVGRHAERCMCGAPWCRGWVIVKKEGSG